MSKRTHNGCCEDPGNIPRLPDGIVVFYNERDDATPTPVVGTGKLYAELRQRGWMMGLPRHSGVFVVEVNGNKVSTRNPTMTELHMLLYGGLGAALERRKDISNEQEK